MYPGLQVYSASESKVIEFRETCPLSGSGRSPQETAVCVCVCVGGGGGGGVIEVGRGGGVIEVGRGEELTEVWKEGRGEGGRRRWRGWSKRMTKVTCICHIKGFSIKNRDMNSNLEASFGC